MYRKPLVRDAGYLALDIEHRFGLGFVVDRGYRDVEAQVKGVTGLHPGSREDICACGGDVGGGARKRCVIAFPLRLQAFGLEL